MSCSNFSKHASGSGGTVREPSQKVGWRESLARWFTGGLSSLLSMLLLSWGLVVPTQAASIFNYAGPMTIDIVYTAESPKVIYPDSDSLDLINTDFTLNACVSQAHYQNGPGHSTSRSPKRSFVSVFSHSQAPAWERHGWWAGFERDAGASTRHSHAGAWEREKITHDYFRTEPPFLTLEKFDSYHQIPKVRLEIYHSYRLDYSMCPKTSTFRTMSF